MSAMASQITSVSIVCSIVCSVAGQRKHQSSASLAFVKGIRRWPVNSLHKGPVTRKMSYDVKWLINERHPTARPLERAMGLFSEFIVWTKFWFSSLSYCVQYPVLFDKDISRVYSITEFHGEGFRVVTSANLIQWNKNTTRIYKPQR